MNNNYFSKETCYIDCEFKTSDELFDFIGREMEKKGYAREGFAESLKLREKNFPTALPGTDFAIAVPHTDPEFIKIPFVGIVVNKNQIDFVQMGSDNVIIKPKLFFVLGFMKDEAIKYQVKILQMIINKILVENNGEIGKKLMDAKSVDECMNLISVLEEQLHSD